MVMNDDCDGDDYNDWWCCWWQSWWISIEMIMTMVTNDDPPPGAWLGSTSPSWRTRQSSRCCRHRMETASTRPAEPVRRSWRYQSAWRNSRGRTSRRWGHYSHIPPAFQHQNNCHHHNHCCRHCHPCFLYQGSHHQWCRHGCHPNPVPAGWQLQALREQLRPWLLGVAGLS